MMSVVAAILQLVLENAPFPQMCRSLPELAKFSRRNSVRNVPNVIEDSVAVLLLPPLTRARSVVCAWAGVEIQPSSQIANTE
jgi:hypothetical protein